MSRYARATVSFLGERVAQLDLLVPCSWELMEKGLQGRRSLGSTQGMLFLSRAWPREQSIAMWIAKVRFPLAMIWVKADQTVGDIVLALPGDRRNFSHRGVGVVETNLAFVDQVGLRPGDGAVLSWERVPCPRFMG